MTRPSPFAQRLRLGHVIPAVFWATTLTCGFILRDYNHATSLVCELGAVGTPSRWAFTAGLLTCALLSAVFIRQLFVWCRAREVAVFPVLVLAAFAISIGGAAVFPLPMRAHLYAGQPSLLMPLSPMFALLLWRGRPQPASIRPWAAVSLTVMVLGFLAFRPDLLPAWPGLKQRVFHLGWTLWFIGLEGVLGGTDTAARRTAATRRGAAQPTSTSRTRESSSSCENGFWRKSLPGSGWP